MFVRFVVGADCENAAWLTGVISIAREVDDAGQLHRHESDLLAETFAWLNEHLPCPPFSARFRSGIWTRDAVCWFRPEAREPIGHLWSIVAILKEHGVPVRLLTSAKPGRIVYEDRFQVVAETPRWA